jgi:membrane protease YdiL (CAAX protease family)
VPEPDLAPHPSAPADDAPPEVRWGSGEAFVGWVGSFLLGQIVGTLVFALSGADDFDDLSLGVMTLANTGLWAGFVGAAFLISRFKGSGLGFVRDIGLRMRALDIPVGLAWGVVTQLVALPLVYAPILYFTDVTSEDLSEPAKDLADRAAGPFGVVMLVLFVGIFAPIAEEIFWRGIVLRALDRRWGQWPAIVGSGMFFAAAHFQPVQFAGLTIIGGVLGFITLRYGRLGPAIAAHMAFNLVAVINLLNS